MNFSRLNTPERISAIAIVVIAISAFLPWASFLGISKNGIDGDGSITLVIAVIGAVVLLMTTAIVREGRAPGRAAKITQLVAGALVALIGIVDMSSLAAIGLYLTFFAGAAWVVGGAWDLTIKPDAPPDPTAASTGENTSTSDGPDHA